MIDLKTLSDLKYNRELSQKTLRETQLGRLLLVHDGAMWYCDTPLLNILSIYKDEDEIALPDANNIPRKVKPKELLRLAMQHHQEIMNDWLIEYNKLAKIRTIKDVIPNK